MTLKRTKTNYRLHIVKVYTRNSIEWDSVGANLCVRPLFGTGEHIGSSVPNNGRTYVFAHYPERANTQIRPYDSPKRH